MQSNRRAMPSGLWAAGWPGVGRGPRLIVVRGCLRLPHRWAMARQRWRSRRPLGSALPRRRVLCRCCGDSARFATGQLLLSSGKQSEQSVIEGVLLLARPSHCWAVDGGRNVVTQSGAGIAPLWRSQVEPASIPGPLGSCEQLVRKAHACAKGHTWPVQRNESHH